MHPEVVWSAERSEIFPLSKCHPKQGRQVIVVVVVVEVVVIFLSRNKFDSTPTVLPLLLHSSICFWKFPTLRSQSRAIKQTLFFYALNSLDSHVLLSIWLTWCMNVCIHKHTYTLSWKRMSAASSGAGEFSDVFNPALPESSISCYSLLSRPVQTRSYLHHLIWRCLKRLKVD